MQFEAIVCDEDGSEPRGGSIFTALFDGSPAISWEVGFDFFGMADDLLVFGIVDICFELLLQKVNLLCLFINTILYAFHQWDRYLLGSLVLRIR